MGFLSYQAKDQEALEGAHATHINITFWMIRWSETALWA